MVSDVLEEVHDAAGDVTQQRRMIRHLVGMGVVTAVGRVEDASPQVRQVYAGDVPEVLRYGVAAVLDLGRVLAGHLFQNVLTPEHVFARLRQELHDGA